MENDDLCQAYLQEIILIIQKQVAITKFQTINWKLGDKNVIIFSQALLHIYLLYKS